MHVSLARRRLTRVLAAACTASINASPPASQRETERANAVYLGEVLQISPFDRRRAVLDDRPEPFGHS